MPDQNRFYNIKSQYQLKFFQVPKILFFKPKYKSLSLAAKMAFGLLLDRLQLSIKNNWIDDNGNIYFIFTGQELGDLLNCGHTKVNSIKKELTEVGLLKMKRTIKANRMYLLRPEITKNDIYSIDKYEEQAPKTDTKPFPQNGNTNPEPFPQNGNTYFRKTETNDTDINETTNKDTINTDTTKNPEKISDNDLLELEQKQSDIFTPQQINLLKLIANNKSNQYYNLQDIILKAKKHALNKHSIKSSDFDFIKDDDVDRAFTKLLYHCIKGLKFNKIKKIENYMYTSIVVMFETLGNERALELYKNTGGTENIYW